MPPATPLSKTESRLLGEALIKPNISGYQAFLFSRHLFEWLLLLQSHHFRHPWGSSDTGGLEKRNNDEKTKIPKSAYFWSGVTIGTRAEI